MKLKIKQRIPAFVEMNMATKIYKDKRKKRSKQRLDREIKDYLYDRYEKYDNTNL